MFKKIALSMTTCALFVAGNSQAEHVEIYLTDMLDSTQSGYCIDIARAQGDKANPEDGLQGHTCYSPKGELMVDQIFDTEKFAEGLLYMPEFDVCMQVNATKPGSALSLAACDSSDSQTFEFSGEGAIVPATASDMCVTLSEETTTGKSKVNQRKVMSLETCSDDISAYQTWAVRSSL